MPTLYVPAGHGTQYPELLDVQFLTYFPAA
jgi:hypothetical protein